MKQYVSESDFLDAMVTDDTCFSYKGARVLYEYLEQLDGEMTFDRVEVRCSYCEYPSIIEAAEENGWEYERYDAEDKDEDEEDKEANALEFLEGKTMVITFDGGVIIAVY